MRLRQVSFTEDHSYRLAKRTDERDRAHLILSARGTRFARELLGAFPGEPAFLKNLSEVHPALHRDLLDVLGADARLDLEAIASNDGMVLVPGGTFQMGCLDIDPDCSNSILTTSQKPPHTVTLSDFYIGKYEVTQKLWQDVTGKAQEIPWNSEQKKCDQCPVTDVSWDEVQIFLQKLNQTTPAGQKPYRLPTEAEWEYAARECGKAVLFGNGKNEANTKEINFQDRGTNASNYEKYKKKLLKVGSFKPNALGLYDMSGNVSEWCNDKYSEYNENPSTNPDVQDANGRARVTRNGNYFTSARQIKTTYRLGSGQDSKAPGLGFRLARSK